MAATERGAAELRMDPASLCRGETFKVAVDRTVREIQEMRREAASPIIIPDRVPPALGGPGGPLGSGGIQFP